MRVDSLLRRLVGGDPKPMAALDIGPMHWQWALLDRQAGQWRLQLRQWPVLSDWLEGGRLIDYSAVVEAVSKGLAEAGVRRLAMTLPAEVCHCDLLEPPTGRWRWLQHRWLSQQALKGPLGSQAVWAAHQLEEPTPGWRLMSASIESLQDWQGLAEAAQCELVCLEDAHQAGWRALDQWHPPPVPDVCLFQVGLTCVQALCERLGRWQWAWRMQDRAVDPLERCLEFAANRPMVFLVGEGDLATRIRVGLEQAGHPPREPSPNPELVLEGDFTVSSWPALGLAGLRWWT